MKLCPRCDRVLTPLDFGICRARPDGRNLYCKQCIREKVGIQRTQIRAYKLAQKAKRKPCTKARPLWKEKRTFKLPVYDVVRMAVQRGAKTQEEIQRMTKLSWDDIADGLARLYDQGLLCRQSLKQRIYKLAEVA